MLRGVSAEFFECLRQPVESLFAGDISFELPLHRANDRRSAKARGGVDDRADEVAGLLPDGGVGMRERPFVNDPARTGADGGNLKRVPIEQALQFGGVDGVGCGRKDFHRIEAKPRGVFAAVSEAVVKDKRSTAGLGGERDGDGAFHRAAR